VLQAGEFKLKPGIDVVPYDQLKELRLEDGLDVSRKVGRGGRGAGRGRAQGATARRCHPSALRSTPTRRQQQCGPLLCSGRGRPPEHPAPRPRPPAEQEEYLSEEEFEVVFGMDKEDFRAMPPWKRINAKKSKGLF
jgi:hypothetical protein